MATYKGRIEGELKNGDKVVFEIGGETITSEVTASSIGLWLEIFGHSNGYIFDKLGLDAEKLCERCYGYPTDRCGYWPYAKSGDFAALTRCVNAIYEEIEKRKQPTSTVDITISPSLVYTDSLRDYKLADLADSVIWLKTVSDKKSKSITNYSKPMLKKATNLIKRLQQPLKNYMLLGWVKIESDEYVVTEEGQNAFIHFSFGLTDHKTIEEYAEAEVKRLKEEEKK